MLSSFASSLVSIFHEPGKHFETLSIIEDVFRVASQRTFPGVPVSG